MTLSLHQLRRASLTAMTLSSLFGCAVAEHNKPAQDEQAVSDGFAFGDPNNVEDAEALGMGGVVIVAPSSGGTDGGGTGGTLSTGGLSSGGTASGGGVSTGGTMAATCDLMISYTSDATEVMLTGTLTSPEWAESLASGAIAMTSNGETHSTIVTVPAGEHQYKFIADGNWEHDPGQPSVTIDFNTNNVIQCTP